MRSQWWLGAFSKVLNAPVRPCGGTRECWRGNASLGLLFNPAIFLLDVFQGGA